MWSVAYHGEFNCCVCLTSRTSEKNATSLSKCQQCWTMLQQNVASVCPRLYPFQFSHLSITCEPTISEVKGACSDDWATEYRAADTHAKISQLVASLPTSRQQVVFALLVPSCQQVCNKLLTICNKLVDIIRLVARLFQQV